MLAKEKMQRRAFLPRPRRRILSLAVAALLVFCIAQFYPPLDITLPLPARRPATKPGRLSWEEFRDGVAARPGPGEATTYARTPMDCGVDVERLAAIRSRHNVGEDFDYVKRYVRFQRGGVAERKSVTETTQPFMPHPFLAINSSVGSHSRECPAPLEVAIPDSGSPETVDASDFLFGVSTTLDRFLNPDTNPIQEWKFWLTDGKGSSNGGKLVVLLSSASADQVAELQELLRRVGIDADVLAARSSEMAVRYLRIVPTLYSHPSRPGRKWLVTVDDDTFFPSMHALTAALAEHDHTQPMYIGTLSEDMNNILRHGSQAFGGAGVFLSAPAARLVTEKFDSCASRWKIRQADTGWGPQGDVLLRKCLYENSDVRLTTLPGLWQLDIRGDPAGFFESGVAPLSLHHYRGGMWFVARALQYARAAYACGEACVLLRLRAADDFIVSGFSVAHYPRGIDFDLRQVERTFSAMPKDFGGNMDYAMGPQRKGLHGTGRKVAWELQEAEIGADGSLVQVYVRHGDDKRFLYKGDNEGANRDGIVEVVWIPA